MKVLYSLFLLAALYLSGAVYFDYQASEKTYRFCESLSIGNNSDHVKVQAKEQGLKFLLNLSNNQLWVFSYQSKVPLFKSNGCEIELADSKIKQRNFIKL